MDVISIRESLRDWYFGEESGGMFLSQPARDRYFRLYDELESAIAGLNDDAESLSREGAAELRQRASALRHQLAADLGVAERPRTKWIMPREDPTAPIAGIARKACARRQKSALGPGNVSATG